MIQLVNIIFFILKFKFFIWKIILMFRMNFRYFWVVSFILYTCDIHAGTIAEVEFPFRAARFMTVHTRRRVAVWKYERLYFASWIRTFVIFLRKAELVHVCVPPYFPSSRLQSVFFSCRSVFLPPAVESSRSSSESFSKLARLWFNYETDTNTVRAPLEPDSLYNLRYICHFIIEFV